MNFPFDAWCHHDYAQGGRGHKSAGSFTDVTLVYPSLGRRPSDGSVSSVQGDVMRCDAALPKSLLPVSVHGEQWRSAVPCERSIDLHRVILAQASPSYFGWLLQSTSGGTGDVSRGDVRWIREDRLAADVCTTAIPVLLRYLYSGTLGVPDEQGALRPLDAEHLCPVLLVSMTWCSGNNNLRGEHDRLIPLVEYLFEYIVAICDAAAVPRPGSSRDDDESCSPGSAYVPTSQVRMTLPSQQRHGSDGPACDTSGNNSQYGASTFSRQQLAACFIKIVSSIDLLASSQQLHNRSNAARQQRPLVPQQAHVLRASDVFPSAVEIFRGGAEQISMAEAASMQQRARDALRNPEGMWVDAPLEVGGRSTLQDLFGVLWCRARESLVAITIESLGNDLLLSLLPELEDSNRVCESRSCWESCALHICRDCETMIADQPARSAASVSESPQPSNQELVSFKTDPSLVDNVFGLSVWLKGGPTMRTCDEDGEHALSNMPLFCGVSLRCICWLLWRWASVLQIAVEETKHARRELLLGFCSHFASGLPTEESIARILAHSLGSDGTSQLADNDEPVDTHRHIIVNVGRAYRTHDVLRLQLAALGRFAAALITRLSPTGNENGMHQLRDEMSEAMPTYYVSSSMQPPSLWSALSETIRSSPGRLVVRGEPQDTLMHVSIMTVPWVHPLALWSSGVCFRDGKLVRWMVQEHFALLDDSASAIVSEDGSMSLWSALSHASSSLLRADESTTSSVKRSVTKRPRSANSQEKSDDQSDDEKLPRIVVHSKSTDTSGEEQPSLRHNNNASWGGTLGQTSPPNRTVPPDDRTESLPLFSTHLMKEMLTAVTPHFFSNPNTLFPATVCDSSQTPPPAPQRSWKELLAEDEASLTSWMSEVCNLCDSLVPVLGRQVEHTVEDSSADSPTQDDDGSTQKPLLLTAQSQRLRALRKQLEDTRRIRDAHIHHVRAALHTSLAEELRDAQRALCSLTTEAIQPAIDEVKALETTRASVQQEMSSLQENIHELSSKLEMVQHQCTTQLDAARSQLSQYRNLVATQELRATRIMDTLDTQIIPALEEKRNAVLSKMLETVSSTVSALQEHKCS